MSSRDPRDQGWWIPKSAVLSNVGRALIVLGAGMLGFALSRIIFTPYYYYTPILANQVVGWALGGEVAVILGVGIKNFRAIRHATTLGFCILATTSVLALVMEPKTATAIKPFWVLMGILLALLAILWVARKIKARRKWRRRSPLRASSAHRR